MTDRHPGEEQGVRDEFQTVRQTLALHNSMAISGEQPSSRSVESLVDALAALSSIERHTQNMALELGRMQAIAEQGQEPLARLILDATTILRAHRIARAALPAREKEEER